jgi:hypothetical protein
MSSFLGGGWYEVTSKYGADQIITRVFEHAKGKQGVYSSGLILRSDANLPLMSNGATSTEGCVVDKVAVVHLLGHPFPTFEEAKRNCKKPMGTCLLPRWQQADHLSNRKEEIKTVWPKRVDRPLLPVILQSASSQLQEERHLKGSLNFDSETFSSLHNVCPPEQRPGVSIR